MTEDTDVQETGPEIEESLFEAPPMDEQERMVEAILLRPLTR